MMMIVVVGVVVVAFRVAVVDVVEMWLPLENVYMVSLIDLIVFLHYNNKTNPVFHHPNKLPNP
jgi:hypothetical protein